MKMETDTNLLKGKIVKEIRSNNVEDELTMIFTDGSLLKVEVHGREDGSFGLQADYKEHKPKEKKK